MKKNIYFDETCISRQDVYPRFMGAIQGIVGSAKDGSITAEKAIDWIEEELKDADEALRQLPPF